MFTDPLIERLVWAIGIVATVAVMATHGNAAQTPSLFAPHAHSFTAIAARM
ncbi:MAG: hypothetical protein ACJ8EL_19330 [Rhizomicrobium sp.]|jgi:hypothetical protein